MTGLANNLNVALKTIITKSIIYNSVVLNGQVTTSAAPGSD